MLFLKIIKLEIIRSRTVPYDLIITTMIFDETPRCLFQRFQVLLHIFIHNAVLERCRFTAIQHTLPDDPAVFLFDQRTFILIGQHMILPIHDLCAVLDFV